MRNTARVGFAVTSLLLVFLGAGCTVVRKAADVPAEAVRTVRTVSPVGAKPAEPAVDPVLVQQTLMRFADEFASGMTIGVDNLRHGTNALSHAECLRWKLAFGTAACTIASGPNAIADLLDMTVFVTETRVALEEYWQPKVFGDSARILVENCRSSEKGIWEVADTVFKPEQQAALREAIQVWHHESCQPENLLVVRAVGLAKQVAQVSQAHTSKSASLLGLLMLDPLAELDPTRRELAQTRLFAERALFVAQKMPTLLRWQTELLSAETLEQPAVQQWATNATQVAASADRFSRAAERFPQQISDERAEIIKALQAQESALTPVLKEARETLAETRETLAAGAQMSATLNTTLTTFDGVLKRLGVGEPDASGSSTNSEPFRIQDYAETAVKLEGAARQLTELFKTFDQTIGETSRTQLAKQFAPVVQQAQAGGKDLADYVFWKSVLLVAVVLLAAAIYRLLAALMSRAARNKTEPK